MSHEIRILQLADRDTILQYERQKLLAIEPQVGDSADAEFEHQMLEWHAPWRTEALEHYLPLGWSFSVSTDVGIQGYFLAQPQIFTRGLTQTLWIERVQFNSGEVLGMLLEVAYKLCREKHFQQLLVGKSPGLEAAVAEAGAFHELLSKFERIEDGVLGIKTSKF